jgi:hypothetical protein
MLLWVKEIFYKTQMALKSQAYLLGNIFNSIQPLSYNLNFTPIATLKKVVPDLCPSLAKQPTWQKAILYD